MYNLNSHLLSGDTVTQAPSQNHGGVIQPRLLVFHYTGCSFEVARNTFLNHSGSDRKSAHLLVNVDGAVTQLVPFNLRAWHAGESTWGSLSDINTHSIGIEVVNFGYLNKLASGRFISSDGKVSVPPDEVVEARHKNPNVPYRFWQAFSPAQIDACKALASLLVSSYGLEAVVGHDDIAPSRKQDPGPAFPLVSVAAHATSRDAPSVQPASREIIEVNVVKLNIRSGPGTNHALVAPPLPQGTQMVVLSRPPGDWIEVEPVRTDSKKGWVYAAYTRELVA